MEQGKVYTEENTLKTKVHALFTKKFTEAKERTKEVKQKEHEWLKYAPERMSKEEAEILEEYLSVENIKKSSCNNEEECCLRHMAHVYNFPRVARITLTSSIIHRGC
jgi:hypothetical protein